MSTAAAPDAVTGAALQGSFHGGSQPVTGVHVHLLAAATTGYGAASTSLLMSNLAGTDSIGGYVTTDSSGNFSITGDYTCTTGTQVYLLGTGGNPGLSGGQTNPNLALMTVLGQCPSADTFATSTPTISVNEVTTVGSVYALSGFMTDLSHVSSSGTALGLSGIANAFANAKNLYNVATGTALATTPAGNGTVPQTEINTLANILASCVSTVGASSTPCSTLFSSALNGSTQPSDTVTAALNIAHAPGTNVSALYGLQAGTGAPYGPALTGAPSDFSVALSFTGGGLNGPNSMAVDGLGNVWMTNSASSISEFNGVTGAAMSPSAGYTGNGLNYPFTIAIDGSNNAWAVNVVEGSVTQTTVSKFTPGGTAASGSPFTGGGLLTYFNYNVYSPRDIAFDASGNAWIVNDNNISVTELNGTTGAAISPSTGYSLGAGYAGQSGIAIDSLGHAWISGFNGNTLYEMSVANGSLLFTSAYGAGGMEQPYSIAIDSSNNIWMPNQYDPNTLVGVTVSEFNESGAAATGSPYSGGGVLGPVGVAIDGANHVWIANQINGSVSEFSDTGTVLSPSNGFTSSQLFSAGDVGIDGSGNVWICNAVEPGTYANGINLVEFVGLGVPVVTPVATAVATSKLGQRP